MIYNKQTKTYHRGGLNNFRFKDVWLAVGTIFIVTGILLAVGGAATMSGQDKYNASTTAEIIDYIPSERTKVEYIVDGKAYIKWLSFYSSTNQIGDEITITYDSANPRDCGYGGMLLAFILFGVGGGIGILGLTIVIIRVTRLKKNKVLSENGEFIWGTVIQVMQDISLNNNGSHPWIVLCEYTDGEDYYEFKSEHSNIRPRFDTGDSIKIYVNYNSNYKIKDYYVELEHQI